MILQRVPSRSQANTLLLSALVLKREQELKISNICTHSPIQTSTFFTGWTKKISSFRGEILRSCLMESPIMETEAAGAHKIF